MRLAAVALALLGCNQVFDLRSTRPVDAAHEFFDAGVDAPFACPPTGTTPSFQPVLHQVIYQDCQGYQLPPGRAVGMAICDYSASYEYDAYEGPPEAPLVRLSGFNDPAALLQRLSVSPEGDDALALYYLSNLVKYELRELHRGPDGIWRVSGSQPFTAYIASSAPTRAPRRHYIHSDFMGSLLELEQDDVGTWNQVATFTPSDLGVGSVSEPKLSGDGMRLLVTAVPIAGGPARLYYTDRASISGRFRAAEVLVGVPQVFDAYLTEDCGRVYFSGLQSIFYVQRL